MQMMAINDFAGDSLSKSQSVEFKSPFSQRALEMYRSLKEAENMSQPIKEYYNLSRVVEKQLSKEKDEENIYKVSTKEDVI